jgi:hydrogenase maturation protease
MTWQIADRIADALLYEGYLLYPYRATAAKNRYRWQFGVVAPRACGDANEFGPSRMQTECLFEPGADPMIDIKIRFLHVEARVIERLVCAPDEWEAVGAVTVEGRELTSWDEARPREVVLSGLSAREPFTDRVYPLEVAGDRTIEVVRNAAGDVVAREVRECRAISGLVHVGVESAGEVRKLRVRIENVTTGEWGSDVRRADVLRHSLISTHALLAVSDGAFLSLIDPPAHAAVSASSCENLHSWPVLVGQAPQRSLMLSAPIILYDYPSVAPESPGDLFDGTEIDEILTLRVLTLTDQEREEARATDPRAREVVDRAAALPTEALERLHGAVRHLSANAQPAPERSAWEAFLNPAGTDGEETLEINGVRVVQGSVVRLRPPPGRRADAMDMFLAGQTATVAAVYRDLEGQAHVAVTVDAGRAADLHESTGRYFYFRPDEIELLDSGAEHGSREPVRPTARVLVAGIGNIFLGDDGFGPAVIQRLASRALPDWAKVEDFGIRGVHLAYELLGASPPYETTIIVDAVSRGGAPGTLYVLEPEVGACAPTESLDAHTLNVETVLGFLEHIGGKPGRVLIVGCEVGSVAPEMGLSDPVTRAVDGAAELVAKLIAEER